MAEQGNAKGSESRVRRYAERNNKKTLTVGARYRPYTANFIHFSAGLRFEFTSQLLCAADRNSVQTTNLMKTAARQSKREPVSCPTSILHRFRIRA